MTDSSGAVSVTLPLNRLRSWLLPWLPRQLRNMVETHFPWKILAATAGTFLGILLCFKCCSRRWPFFSFMGGCFGRTGKKVLPKSRRNTPTQDSPGYLGLRNEGSTCYLNSIIQCLFMTPDFTNSILRRNPDPFSSHVKVFQKLFLMLQYGTSPPSTLDLMRCFGIQEGRQQDVEEHFRILINNVPEDIQQLFRIQMVHSLTCNGCKHEDVMQNPLLCLPLAINGPEPSVVSALYDFHGKNVLNMDNQCYCSICKRKEDATSRHYFTVLPKILVVHLKRYEICDGQFKKITRPVSVPYSLRVPVGKFQEAASKGKRQEVNRIAQEEAAQHQKYKDQYTSVDTREDFTTADHGKIEEHQQHKNEDSVTYNLFAHCNHRGGLRGGHYTAEIMSFDNNHWYSFNDKQVKEMSSRREQKEIQSDFAYLLMYYQEQENPRFLEEKHLPRDIQRWIDDIYRCSRQNRTHPV